MQTCRALSQTARRGISTTARRIPTARSTSTVGSLGATPTIDDTYDPDWNFSFPPVVIEEGSSLSIDLFDSDDLDDDTIFRGCEVDLDSQFVKQGDTTCHGFTLAVQVI